MTACPILPALSWGELGAHEPGPSGASPGHQSPRAPGQLSQRNGRGCRLQASPGLVSSSCPTAQTPRLWSFHSCTWGAPDPGSRLEVGARLREPSRCHMRRTPRRGGRTGSVPAVPAWPSAGPAPQTVSSPDLGPTCTPEGSGNPTAQPPSQLGSGASVACPSPEGPCGCHRQRGVIIESA